MSAITVSFGGARQESFPSFRSSLSRIGLSATWVVAAVGLQLLRSRRTPVWESIWAEDGHFLYARASGHPVTNTVLAPLAGYLQVVPRLLAQIAVHAPVEYAALTMTLLAAFTCALLSLFVFAATRDVLPHRWQRVSVAALLVVHPAAGYEVNAALNNLHWFFMYAAFWGCLSKSRSGRGIALNAVVIGLAALSDPLTALLLPIAAWRAVRHRESAARILSGVLVGCLILQYTLAIADYPKTPLARRYAPGIVEGYLLRVVDSSLVGDTRLKPLWQHERHWLAYFVAAVVLAALAGMLAYHYRHSRPTFNLLALALVYSVAFFVTAFLARGGIGSIIREPFGLTGSRYTIVPLAFMYTAFILAAGLLWPLLTPHLGRVYLVPTLVLTLIATQLAVNYAPAGPRTASANWTSQLIAARKACADGRVGERPPGPHLAQGARPLLASKSIVLIPEAPWVPFKVWALPVWCRRLR